MHSSPIQTTQKKLRLPDSTEIPKETTQCNPISSTISHLHKQRQVSLQQLTMRCTPGHITPLNLPPKVQQRMPLLTTSYPRKNYQSEKPGKGKLPHTPAQQEGRSVLSSMQIWGQESQCSLALEPALPRPTSYVRSVQEPHKGRPPRPPLLSNVGSWLPPAPSPWERRWSSRSRTGYHWLTWGG